MTEEQQYAKGFNHGYLLTKHEPELVEKILRTGGSIRNGYFEGFVSGREEYALEAVRELDDLRNRGAEIDRDGRGG